MLISEEITIKVSPQVAVAYQQATEREKQYLEAIANLLFDKNRKNEIDFLGKIMDEISDRAIKRGLTPEILAAILNE